MNFLNKHFNIIIYQYLTVWFAEKILFLKRHENVNQSDNFTTMGWFIKSFY